MEHFPVMAEQAASYLRLDEGGVFLDTTSGLGGHTGMMARRLKTGRVISLDRDAESLEKAKANTLDCAERITFRHSRFSQLSETLRELGVDKVDGILTDLGVSKYQLTSPGRGFSFQSEGPLDMRMDRGQELTAGDLVNRASEKDLADWISRLGEERRHARRIARATVRARPHSDSMAYASLIASVAPRTGKLHPATRVFQALRMVVNGEEGELDALLEQGPEWIRPGGRWVVIAFQSIDDRRVKRAFQALAREGRAAILTKHVVRPEADEIRTNPPSRSAVMRALEMLGEDKAGKRN
jgi:16S rRNA (cytosine1402-N4)-methyltransferase